MERADKRVDPRRIKCGVGWMRARVLMEGSRWTSTEFGSRSGTVSKTCSSNGGGLATNEDSESKYTGRDGRVYARKWVIIMAYDETGLADVTLSPRALI
jgi:hypothetical protein